MGKGRGDPGRQTHRPMDQFRFDPENVDRGRVIATHQGHDAEDVKTVHRSDTGRSAAILQGDRIDRPRCSFGLHGIDDNNSAGLLQRRQAVQKSRAHFEHAGVGRELSPLQKADSVDPNPFVAQKFIAQSEDNGMHLAVYLLLLMI